VARYDFPCASTTYNSPGDFGFSLELQSISNYAFLRHPVSSMEQQWAMRHSCSVSCVMRSCPIRQSGIICFLNRC